LATRAHGSAPTEPWTSADRKGLTLRRLFRLAGAKPEEPSQAYVSDCSCSGRLQLATRTRARALLGRCTAHTCGSRLRLSKEFAAARTSGALATCTAGVVVVVAEVPAGSVTSWKARPVSRRHTRGRREGARPPVPLERRRVDRCGVLVIFLRRCRVLMVVINWGC
jgi:hypothetical protein